MSLNHSALADYTDEDWEDFFWRDLAPNPTLLDQAWSRATGNPVARSPYLSDWYNRNAVLDSMGPVADPLALQQGGAGLRAALSGGPVAPSPLYDAFVQGQARMGDAEAMLGLARGQSVDLPGGRVSLDTLAAAGGAGGQLARPDMGDMGLWDRLKHGAAVGAENSGLMSVLRFLGRTGATFSGVSTGLFGADLNMPDGSKDVATGGIFSGVPGANVDWRAVLRRASEPWQGENEDYGWGRTDFLTTREGEGVRNVGRVIAAGALDLASDPTTYLTAGTASAGRKAAAEGLGTALQAAARGGRLGAVDALVAGSDDAARTFARSANPATVRALGEQAGLRVDRGVDDIIATLSREELADAAREGLLNQAGATFAARGPAGLRSWTQELGGEAGEQVWRTAFDTPGAARRLRVEVPFWSKAGFNLTRNPEGALTRALNNETFLGRGSAKAREFLRGKGASNVGRYGKAWQAAADAGLDGADDTYGRRWGEYLAARGAESDIRQVLRQAGAESTARAARVASFIQMGDPAATKRATEAFNEFVQLRGQDTGDAAASLAARGFGPEEIARGQQAAESMFESLTEIGEELLQDVNGDLMVGVDYLNTYLPRILTEEVKADMALRRGADKARPGTTAHLMSRSGNWVQWGADEDGLKVARFLSPAEVAAAEGKEVFETGAIDILVPYLAATERVLAKQRVAKVLAERGLLADDLFKQVPRFDDITRSTGATPAVDTINDLIRKLDDPYLEPGGEYDSLWRRALGGLGDRVGSPTPRPPRIKWNADEILEGGTARAQVNGRTYTVAEELDPDLVDEFTRQVRRTLPRDAADDVAELDPRDMLERAIPERRRSVGRRIGSWVGKTKVAATAAERVRLLEEALGTDLVSKPTRDAMNAPVRPEPRGVMSVPERPSSRLPEPDVDAPVRGLFGDDDVVDFIDKVVVDMPAEGENLAWMLDVLQEPSSGGMLPASGLFDSTGRPSLTTAALMDAGWEIVDGRFDELVPPEVYDRAARELGTAMRALTGESRWLRPPAGMMDGDALLEARRWLADRGYYQARLPKQSGSARLTTMGEAWEELPEELQGQFRTSRTDMRYGPGVLDQFREEAWRVVAENSGWNTNTASRKFLEEVEEATRRMARRAGFEPEAGGSWQMVEPQTPEAADAMAEILDDMFEANPRRTTAKDAADELRMWATAQRGGRTADDVVEPWSFPEAPAALTVPTTPEFNTAGAGRGPAADDLELDVDTLVDEVSASLADIIERQPEVGEALVEALGDGPGARLLDDTPIAMIDTPRTGWAVRDDNGALVGFADSPDTVADVIAGAEAGTQEALARWSQRDRLIQELLNDRDAIAEAISADMVPLDPGEFDDYMEAMSTLVSNWSRRSPEDVAKGMSWDASERTAATIDMVNDGWVPVTDVLSARVTDRWGELAPQEVAAVLSNRFEPMDASAIGAAWDGLTSMFKMQATSGRGPGYIMRNVMGGMVNAGLMGARAGDFNDAIAMIRAGRAAVKQAEAKAKAAGPDKLPEDFIEGAVKDVFVERFGDDAAEMYATYRGYAESETVAQSYAQQQFTGLERGFSTYKGSRQGTATPQDRLDRFIATGRTGDRADNPVLRAAERLGDTRWVRFWNRQSMSSEEYLRLAAYRAGTRLYGSDEVGRGIANLRVKASQFDYTDLSPLEQQLVRKWIPFYTWSKNNIPLQVRATLTHPRYQAKIRELKQGMEELTNPGDEDRFEDGELPPWMREGWHVDTGWRPPFAPGEQVDPRTGEVIPAASLTVGIEAPAKDLNAWLGGPGSGWRETLGALHPIVKTGIESATGVSTFTGAPFPDSETAPAWAKVLPFLTKDTADGGEVGVPARLAAPRNLAPWLGLWDRQVAPAGRVVRDAVTGQDTSEGDRYRERLVSTSLSSLLGVPAGTLNEAQVGAMQRGQQFDIADDLRVRGIPEDIAFDIAEQVPAGTGPSEVWRTVDALLSQGVPVERLPLYVTVGSE